MKTFVDFFTEIVYNVGDYVIMRDLRLLLCVSHHKIKQDTKAIKVS